MHEHDTARHRMDALRRRILTAACIAGNVAAIRVEERGRTRPRITLTVYRAGVVEHADLSLAEAERLSLPALTKRLAGTCPPGA